MTTEYKAPKIVRMEKVTNGRGDCWPSGSGDVEVCDVGNNATGFGCLGPGNAASGDISCTVGNDPF